MQNIRGYARMKPKIMCALMLALLVLPPLALAADGDMDAIMEPVNKITAITLNNFRSHFH